MSNAWKARERDTTWDAVIAAAIPYGYHVRHEAGVVDDRNKAWRAAHGIYSARRHFKISLKPGVDENPDGTFTIWFILFDPEEAKEYIAAKVARGERLEYNVLDKGSNKRRRKDNVLS